MKIIIAGDLVPTQTNIDKFTNSNLLEKMDTKFQKVWCKADFRMFNLECPLGKDMKAMDKSGPNLIAPTETIYGIKSLKPNLIFLSNNHIKDYGEEGIDNTIRLLKENNINYTGIVNNSKENAKAYYIEKDDIKVGIYNLCENEFSVATIDSKGGNPLNEIKNYKEIRQAKEECDYLIIIFHGGKEFYRYPSPNLQRICRNFVDFGADIVITQHSHCVGCVEEYQNGKIIYGQGNFIFDNGVNDEYWSTSLLLNMDINKEGISINYIPIEKNKELIKVSEDLTIVNNFLERSKNIKEEDFIEKEYEKFSKKNLNIYLNIMNKVRFYKKILNRIFNRKFFIKTYNKIDCLRILNIIECEAHRELLICGLKSKINEENNN